MITASNGQEGTELFESENPDLVIVDVKMPGMDGITLLKKSREIPVAIFTGYDQKALTLRMKQTLLLLSPRLTKN